MPNLFWPALSMTRERIRTLHCWMLVCILSAFASLAGAQSPAVPGNGSSLGPGQPPASPDQVHPVAPGGAVIADFDSLMMLIQQTIDPDSWLLAGGQSTITPYPAGVFVDPKGHMLRLKENDKLAIDLPKQSTNAPRHPWRQSSNLRTISLKQIDASLASARSKGLQPTVDLLQLAGLSRISYVKVLAAEEDVLLSGPAGDSEFGFLLGDLATTASLINAHTAPLGCSIEPTNAGLLAAQEFLGERGTIDRLARSPKLITEQLQEKIGPHSVQVFGLSQRSSTALALVDADEHMKRVGFGSASTNPPIKNYFDFLDEQPVVPKQSMIRWWFAYSDSPIESTSAGNLFQLPENCVCVLSEQQWVTQQAGRAPTGDRDPAAEKFARAMTEQLPQLRRTHPSYARLCGVFEAGVALQLALESTGQGDLRAWFPNLCNLGQALGGVEPTSSESNSDSESKHVGAPKTVEGLTTWHRLKSGTIVAVVSGGVTMDMKQVVAKSNWKESKFLANSSVPEQALIPNSAHAAWWWD